MIERRLGHYEITAHLGSGGMGDVYQATDTRLGRSVALKFIPEAFAHNAERVARFGREAKALASLNHPHIAAIHRLEESNGRGFLVMELVPGQTLDDRIGRHPMPLDDSLAIARQIFFIAPDGKMMAVANRDDGRDVGGGKAGCALPYRHHGAAIQVPVHRVARRPLHHQQPSAG